MKRMINRVTTFPLTFLVPVCLALTTIWLQAQATSSESGTSEGEKLERQMASDIQAKNWKAVEARIADGFQSIHPDGIRDRAGEIALLKKIELRCIYIYGFQVEHDW